MKRSRRFAAVAALALSAALGSVSEARACGGFFCSTAQPVNQAAERIVFAENDDGTVTAVIQILYQGPSENFSWLLPLSSVPTPDQVGLGSNLAFARLQNATNPQYSLTTRVEGTCKSSRTNFDASAPGRGQGPNESGGSGGAAGDDVTVEASGTIGAFDWTVISLAEELDDPAAAAVLWLDDNGYDVPAGSSTLLGPYLEDGNVLFALKLTKGSDVGSIRPIALTYAASQPMIPIKLTAVAANDDMGVMAWLLARGRGVPQNYLALELNEARINWFNPASNYNDVVIAAADEAGGRGFVTEFAGPTTSLREVIWSSSEQAQWQNFRSSTFDSLGGLLASAASQWGTWDGFWDAARSTLTLPSGVPFADLQSCPSCYAEQLGGSPTAFLAALDADVIGPVRDMQALVDAHPDVTRLYTTMSAAEMTADPVFTFNPDLPLVSNVHNAERVIECSDDFTESEAPWRIELPQGDIIRGTSTDAANASWPAAVSEQPSNYRILQVSASGQGKVVEDNSGRIGRMLDEYNDTVPRSRGGGCSFTALPNHGAAYGAALLASVFGAAVLRRRRAR